MKVSIIVPVYNTEQYLPRCIDSILSQSFTDFELLLVDDGSTDGCGKICDSYAEKDSRIRVFHKENDGVSSARNLGLDNAKGEWICFVDSDDELMPNGIRMMAEGISDEVDLVMAGYNKYGDNNSLIYSVDALKALIIDKKQAIKEMFSPSDYVYQGYICGKLFRMNEVMKRGIRFSKDIYFNEDRLFITQFICLSERNIYYTTVPVYKYYERLGGAMMSIRKGFNPKFVTDMTASIRMRQLLHETFRDKELLDLADNQIYSSYRRIIGMMQDFQYRDDKRLFRLRRQLIDAIGIKAFVDFEIKRNKRRLLNKIKYICFNKQRVLTIFR